MSYNSQGYLTPNSVALAELLPRRMLLRRHQPVVGRRLEPQEVAEAKVAHHLGEGGVALQKGLREKQKTEAGLDLSSPC